MTVREIWDFRIKGGLRIDESLVRKIVRRILTVAKADVLSVLGLLSGAMR